jgi:predicted  nucleic acid-binding Zn-ribbon protein
MVDAVDRRLLSVYERARLRYGRGLATVRDRVCTGCYVTLPTSASPREGGASLRPCESCGRLLYWR